MATSWQRIRSIAAKLVGPVLDGVALWRLNRTGVGWDADTEPTEAPSTRVRIECHDMFASDFIGIGNSFHAAAVAALREWRRAR
jgi:hypothetical protein